MGRPRAFVAALVALTSAAVSAGTIQLDNRSECEARDGELTCRVQITNRGDDAAEAVAVELTIDGAATRGKLDSIASGKTGRVELRLAAPANGRRAVVMTTRYQDEESYPLSAVSAWPMDFGSVTDRPALEIGIEPVPLRRLRAAAEVTLRNGGREPLRSTLRLATPDEIEATPARIDIALEPGEERTVRFELVNRGAIPPSRYQLFAIAESASPTRATAQVAEASVEVTTPPGPTRRVPWLVAVAALGIAAVGLRSQRAHAGRELRAPLGSLIDGATLVATIAYVVTALRPDLLLIDTIATGGDMASHYWTAHYLRHELLPSGRLLGWVPGNLAGFPAFQLYFPLPFLLMIPLAELSGLPVAFKLVTVAGTLLLPLAAYLALRAFGYSRPAPAFGAVAMLPFLFQEGNSVWGGNLSSTLAGEFAYSLGLALAVLFAGWSFRALVTGRGVVPCALLLAAIGLAHAYTLLFAATTVVLYLAWMPHPAASLRTLAKIAALSFGLIAFWLFPLVGFSEYTSPYADLWSIDGWQQVFPWLLRPALALAALGLVHAYRRRGGRALDPRLGAVLSGIAAAALLYSAARPLGVVDIRFLPFVQVWVALLGAVGLAALLERPLAPLPRALAPLLVLLAVAAAVDRSLDYTPAWVHWNYSGFENRPRWAEFDAVNGYLNGDIAEPRVVFEHSPAHNAAGSIRAFESLPLFSGRSTLEGLYIQSSHLSPEIFYLQSEVSQIASCPLPDFHCARLDAVGAARHLRSFNVSQVVARSEAVRGALTESSDFVSETVIGDYEIFAVRGNSGRYVEPLQLEPVRLHTAEWRRDAFRWFSRQSSLPTPDTPVLIDDRRSRTRLTELTLTETIEAVPRPRALPNDVRVSETIDTHEIVIRTDRRGHPLLVRVAYHPRWRVEGAAEIYLASPGFMLVYPQEETVVLRFGETPLTIAGKVLSVAALLVLLGVAASRLRRTPVAAISETASAGGVAHPRLAVGALVATLVAASILARIQHDDFAPQLFDRGIEHFHAGQLDLAAASFERAIDTSPLSSAALKAYFYRGLVSYRQEQWQDTIDIFVPMIERFPQSKYRAESEYHVGLCFERLGDTDDAGTVYRELVERFPRSPWTERAAENLRRLEHEVL